MKFFYLFFLVMASMALTSCGDLYADEELDTVTSLSESDANTSFTAPDTWQKQVEYGYSKNRITKSFSGQELPHLIGHTHLGTVTSETHKAAIIKDLFADEDVVVIYGEDSSFDIRYVKDVKQAGVDYPFDDIKSRIADRLTVGMDLIKLKWSYKGQTYYTTAIASNDEGGIICDPIASAIMVEKTPGVEAENTILKTGKLLKAQSETEDTQTVYKTFSKPDQGISPLGYVLWSYSISAYSVFDKNGKLASCSASGSGYGHDVFWSCKADAKTTKGNYGDTSHTFAWGYAYGFVGSVTLNFAGSSFSASGSGGQGSGTQMHSANS